MQQQFNESGSWIGYSVMNILQEFSDKNQNAKSNFDLNIPFHSSVTSLPSDGSGASLELDRILSSDSKAPQDQVMRIGNNPKGSILDAVADEEIEESINALAYDPSEWKSDTSNTIAPEKTQSEWIELHTAPNKTLPSTLTPEENKADPEKDQSQLSQDSLDTQLTLPSQEFNSESTKEPSFATETTSSRENHGAPEDHEEPLSEQQTNEPLVTLEERIPKKIETILDSTPTKELARVKNPSAQANKLTVLHTEESTALSRQESPVLQTEESPLLHMEESPPIHAEESPSIHVKESTTLSRQKGPVLPRKENPVLQTEEGPLFPRKESPILQTEESPLLPRKEDPVLQTEKSPLLSLDSLGVFVAEPSPSASSKEVARSSNILNVAITRPSDFIKRVTDRALTQQLDEAMRTAKQQLAQYPMLMEEPLRPNGSGEAIPFAKIEHIRMEDLQRLSPLRSSNPLSMDFRSRVIFYLFLFLGIFSITLGVFHILGQT